MATWEKNPLAVRLQVNKKFTPVILMFDEKTLRLGFGHHRDLSDDEKKEYIFGDPPEKLFWRTIFKVQIGEPLYIGLHRVVFEDPDSLKNLIANLVDYLHRAELYYSKQALVEYAIEKLSDLLKRGARR